METHILDTERQIHYTYMSSYKVNDRLKIQHLTFIILDFQQISLL